MIGNKVILNKIVYYDVVYYNIGVISYFNVGFDLRQILVNPKVILREVGLMTDFEYVIKSTLN